MPPFRCVSTATQWTQRGLLWLTAYFCASTALQRTGRSESTCPLSGKDYTHSVRSLYFVSFWGAVRGGVSDIHIRTHMLCVHETCVCVCVNIVGINMCVYMYMCVHVLHMCLCVCVHTRALTSPVSWMCFACVGIYNLLISSCLLFISLCFFTGPRSWTLGHGCSWELCRLEGTHLLWVAEDIEPYCNEWIQLT